MQKRPLHSLLYNGLLLVAPAGVEPTIGESKSLMNVPIFYRIHVIYSSHLQLKSPYKSPYFCKVLFQNFFEFI